MAFPPAANKKPNPPAANQKPPVGKHVPSTVQDANVSDHSAAIAACVGNSPSKTMTAQATQTVGTNPNAPADRQASVEAVSGVPYTSGSPTGFTPYMGAY